MNKQQKETPYLWSEHPVRFIYCPVRLNQRSKAKRTRYEIGHQCSVKAESYTFGLISYFFCALFAWIRDVSEEKKSMFLFAQYPLYVLVASLEFLKNCIVYG